MVDRIFPAMRARGGYIPTCDHGVPEEVPYENYLHYRKRALGVCGLNLRPPNIERRHAWASQRCLIPMLHPAVACDEFESITQAAEFWYGLQYHAPLSCARCWTNARVQWLGYVLPKQSRLPDRSDMRAPQFSRRQAKSCILPMA